MRTLSRSNIARARKYELEVLQDTNNSPCRHTDTRQARQER